MRAEKMSEALRKRPVVSSEAAPSVKPKQSGKPQKNMLAYASETACGPRKAMLDKAAKTFDRVSKLYKED